MEGLQRRVPLPVAALRLAISSLKPLRLIAVAVMQRAPNLQRTGLRLQVVEAKSPRGDGHSFTCESLVAGVRCLKGNDDNSVVRVVGGILRTP